MTPRLKLLHFFNNFFSLIIFFKFNFFYFFSIKNNSLNYFIYSFFYKYFFSKQIFLIKKKFLKPLIGFYDNNLQKSFLYWFFKNFLIFFNINTEIRLFSKKPVKPLYFLFLNQYFLPIKVLNEKINKKINKNFFFLLIFFSSYCWFTWPKSLKFYLNFIFISKSLSVYIFYNNHFLKVYNL